ncbi:hypothetical protein BN444_01331 [Xanthomonas translucens pv. translucens DSM 18974]|uniref:Uncharacterized protein n=1 Tax=Xanthomonas translucens pv. translucens DSM 18974 TaxID=1261556 RepID=A0A1C3TTB1_XANCT|nr:hypothetical protein BN444_01331 [Xanthomonas translucens pv. translucens DSM 18974]SCB06426.1 hypothetical protein BN444_01331 [Xanthomonas translucens pv. translucens DSM 18974]
MRGFFYAFAGWGGHAHDARAREVAFESGRGTRKSREPTCAR